ncbi:MAG: adenylate cyclase [Verrucomicrobiales bacterium]
MTLKTADGRLPRAILRARSENLAILNMARAAMVGAFVLLLTFLGYGMGLEAWKPSIPLGIYFAATLILLVLGRRSTELGHYSRFAVPLIDAPFVFWIQWQNVESAVIPQGVAGFSISLFVFLVLLAALSLDLKCLLLTAFGGIVLECLLQMKAQVDVGGQSSAAIIIGGSAAICIYASWKRLQMVASLTRESVKRERLGRYFSPAVASMLEQREDESLGSGVSRELTILFSDIRGFTSLSESLSAPEVVSLLNRYHSLMVDRVFEFGGTLDKFIGDGIMAYFNAPVDQNDHAQRAIECALAMQKDVDALNKALVNEGKPPLRIGIGIHTGIAVVGDIGAPSRKEFTAIGDSVNLASRLEGLTKSYDSDILVSAMTKDQAEDSQVFRSVGEATVRGKSKPVQLFAPTD